MSTVSVIFLVMCFVVWSHSHPVLEPKARTQRKAFPSANKQSAKPPLDESQAAKEIEPPTNQLETKADGIEKTETPPSNPPGGIATGSVMEPHVEFLPEQHDNQLKLDQILKKPGEMWVRAGPRVMRVQTALVEMQVPVEPERNLIEKREVRLEPNEIQADPRKVNPEPESFHHLEPRGHQPPPPGSSQNGRYPTATLQITVPHPMALVDAVGPPIARVLDGATHDTVNGIYNVSRHKPIVGGRLHAGNMGYLGHQLRGWFRRSVLGKKKPQKPYNPSKYGLAPPQPTPTWFNTHQHSNHYSQYPRPPPTGYPPPSFPHPVPPPHPTTRG